MGSRPAGEIFYTMDIVRGRSLKDAIRDAHGKLESGTLQVDGWGLERLQLLDAFRGLCNGIAYAHSRGVIHRDIKPANVMVGDFGETIVVDWGALEGESDRLRGAWSPRSHSTPTMRRGMVAAERTGRWRR